MQSLMIDLGLKMEGAGVARWKQVAGNALGYGQGHRMTH